MPKPTHSPKKPAKQGSKKPGKNGHPSIRNYERIQIFGIQDVIQHVGHRQSFYVNGQKYKVRMNNERMKLLARSQTCACCGVQGSFFWLEKNGSNPAHFNLYGERYDGTLVMLTKDHIIPRSKGGKTEQDNLQVLCYDCNYQKQNQEISLEDLLVQRCINDEELRKFLESRPPAHTPIPLPTN